MGAVQRIVKDALGAILFLVCAGALLIYFLGYPGLVITGALAMIFLVCFVALRLSELAAFFVSYSQRKKEPPPATPPGAPPLAQPSYCPKCGSAWVAGAQKCPNCG